MRERRIPAGEGHGPDLCQKPGMPSPPASRRDRGRRAHTASPHLRVIHLERGERPGEEIAGQARRALSVSYDGGMAIAFVMVMCLFS